MRYPPPSLSYLLFHTPSPPASFDVFEAGVGWGEAEGGVMLRTQGQIGHRKRHAWHHRYLPPQ